MKTVAIIFLNALLFAGCNQDKVDVVYTQLHLPVSGNIHSVNLVGADSILICGSNADTGYIFLSTDAGTTWQQPATGFWNPVYDVSTYQNVWWASSKYINYFRSNNYGKNYALSVPANNQMPTGAFDAAVYDILVLDSLTALACGGKNFQEGFLYRTNNGGTTWQLTQTTHEMRHIAISGQQAIAVGYGAIYLSHDAGTTWKLTSAPADFYTGVVYNNGWIACGFDGGIYTSADGVNWHATQQNNTLLGKRLHYNAIYLLDQTGVAVGTNGLASVSYNAGKSWQQCNTTLNVIFNDVVLLNKYKALAVGDNGEAYFINL
ncbi:MAG: hypothetical protein JNK61_03765 [Bacteroidia bacterium]|nr:hypothetical protein [Bacteroidia bacterium]